jgi:hypothetical protein
MQEQCEFGGAACKVELAAGVWEDLGEKRSGFSGGDECDVSSATVMAAWARALLRRCAGDGGQGSMEQRDDGEGRLLLLGRRRSGGTGEGCRRWCWNASPLIGAWAGGGGLPWRREEPERNSSSGAGGAAAVGACSAMGPVTCGPAWLSQRPEPARARMRVALECAGWWLRRCSA